MEKMTFFEINEKMYEIEKALGACIDEETGEIIDDKYAELQGEYDALDLAEKDKTEGLCLMIKDKQAFRDALKAEKKRITDRIATVENEIDRPLKFTDDYVLKGEKFETPKVRCQYRRSKAVEVADESIVPDEYMVEKVTKAPDKMAIKKVLADGGEVRGCNLVENTKLSVK